MGFFNRRAVTVRPVLVHPAQALYAEPDVLASANAFLRAGDNMARSRLLGMTERGWYASPAEASVSSIGATRSGKGTSAALDLETERCALVIFSIKDEWSEMLGLPRVRMGGLAFRPQHLAFDGALPPQGWKAVGFNPISTDYRRSQRIGKAMGKSVGMGKDGEIFAKGAGSLIIGPMLLSAGIGGKSMEWLVRCVQRHDAVPALEILRDSDAPNAASAYQSLDSVRFMPDKMGGSMWGTANTALEPYFTVEAREATRRPPVDLDAFCAALPAQENPLLAVPGYEAPPGCFPTLLVTGSETEQELWAPLYAALKAELVEAAARLPHGSEALLVMDDMAALAADPQLPEFLSLTAGRHLPVWAIYHNDGPFQDRYGEAGAGMAGHFGAENIHRGIKHQATVNRLSAQTGRQFVELTTHNCGRSGGSMGAVIAGTVSPTWQEGTGTAHHDVPMLRPDEITTGHPAHPDLILGFAGDSTWGWFYTIPAHRHPLMLKLAVTTMEFFASRDDVASLRLPKPIDLTRDRGAALSRAGLLERYVAARKALAAAAVEVAA